MSTTQRLSDLFTYDINRTIEGVIKADDESHLRQEVQEFVITKEVAQKLERQFFDAYNDTGGTNGVWISGFYGSGKSHLLKMLSVLLENRVVDDIETGRRFADKVREDNPLLAASIEKAARIPARSIRFNIDQKAILNSTGKDQADAVLAVFMSVFNEMRGYFPRLAWLADLERRMDREGIFADFKTTFREQTGKDWDTERYQVALVRSKFAKAYAAVTAGAVDDGKAVWESARSDYNLTIERFAEEVNDYLSQQAPGFRLNFFVDEVGQYIGDDTKLMTNLQTIAESLYTRCNGNAWVFVTSQEDIEAVLGGLKDKQSQDFSKIQARFKCKLNLTSQNVDEVIELRLLKKTDAGEALLTPIYEQEHKNFATVLSFHEGGTEFRVADSKEEYLRKYPFQPFHFGLLQDCIRALSRQNALMGKHASVGERSLLSIFQDVVKKMDADGLPIGNLPSFDRAFDGLQPILKGEVQASLNTAINNLGEDSFEVRVLKILFLVKYVKNFEATPHHITALLTENFRQDQKALEQDVQTALNKLTRQSYLLRNGTKYEFLTDDEKDIEQEIHNTEVDAVKVNDFLGRMIFEEVIKDTTVTYPDNKQKFGFNRKLDDGPFGRQTNELVLNVITARHPNFSSPTLLMAHSLDKPEAYFVLSAEDRLMDDVQMHLKTDTYLRQTGTPEGEKGLIVQRRAQENHKRRDEIIDQIKAAVGRADILLSGQAVKDIGVGEARNRVTQALQKLITKTYHSLRLLPRDFSYDDATNALLRPAAELAGESGNIGPAEEEMLTFVRRQATANHRVTAKSLLERFGTKPYGWSEGSTATILARLIAGNKLEARADGRDLDNRAAADYLSSNRRVDSLMVSPLADISARDVGRLKRLHQELFNKSNPGREAKEVAEAFRDALREEQLQLRGLLGKKDDFPFVDQLQPYAEALDAFVKLRYNEVFQQLDKLDTDLADLREDRYAPIKAFIDGDQGDIYAKIGKFLATGRENYRHLPPELIQPLQQLQQEEKPYRRGVMSQAKAQLDAAFDAVRDRLEQDRRQVKMLLDGKAAELKAMEEYADLTDTEKLNLEEHLGRHERQLTAERTISGLRQALRDFEEHTFGQLVNQVAALSAAHRRPPPAAPPLGAGGQPYPAPASAPAPKAEEPKPQYTPLPPSRELRDRAGLKSSLIKEEEELERYLNALREAGRAILERGDGIRL
ncbi:BREX system P-loop protein BrxC [Neolewinella aurantiaca]|uniref:BREX system P-loop protein BrxC n=1 Tax=Neolewinella aurantiaca TaxID=2602767 RepID=A0A5C7F9S7_9BACT|nr:BREX system P-loop protein BrxC [Neolewinella aurantiaca]TXF86310.1 BREX system P-loop protein BrxC [Neolewinella aurantiaca]